MKRTNLISLTEAMADFNNSVDSFDLWSGNCWIDKDGCVVVDDHDWDDWDDDDYDDFPHYTKEELEERERKIAELEKKVSEIEKTWCDYEGKMTKEYFERYCMMAVETEDCYGRGWHTVPFYEVDLYILKATRYSWLSDIDYSTKQIKDEIREFLDNAINDWIHTKTDFGSLDELIYSRLE